jgi:hypothetical protein
MHIRERRSGQLRDERVCELTARKPVETVREPRASLRERDVDAIVRPPGSRCWGTHVAGRGSMHRDGLGAPGRPR